MARFLNLRVWPAFMGLALLLVFTGAVWAQSPEGSVNVFSSNPATGSTAGGLSVTISGSGFDNTPGNTVTVTFGGTPATGVAVSDPNTITCTTPAHAIGVVDIVVTNVTIGGSGTGSQLFTYLTTPTVTGLSPSFGPPAGGTSVIITGTSFTGVTGAASVVFGGNIATTYTVNSNTQITATSPAGTGTVDVHVTNGAYGQSPANPPNDQFTYVCNLPTVTSVNPASGTTCGGTHVVITGTNLSGALAVNFGTTAAVSFTVNLDTQISAVSPAHALGILDVTIMTPCGTSATGVGDQFDFTAALVPTITSVSPATGSTAGGTTVTIGGTGFTDASTPLVLFGANAATGVNVNITGTLISCTSPAGAAGTVNVTVTTCGGTSATSTSDQFTYISCLLPTVTVVSPSTGSATGGTPVTLTGTNFTGATAVHFGTALATSVLVVNDTTITCVSPAGTGTVHVTVTTPCGTSATSTVDQFTYGTLPAPTVTAINPTHGPQTGGTLVTITGTNFVSGTGLAVYMGATSYACTGVTFVSATTLTAVTPAHPVGTTTVGVKNPDGQQGFSSTPLYTYDPSAVPTVTGVSPNSGPAGGGTAVTVAGTNLTGATLVSFGGTAATSVVVVSATSITCVSPAHASGLVDVTVTTPSGTSAISAADHFTYQPCTLVCSTNVPTTGTTGAQIQFEATATPTSCTGTVSYLWTFGDTTTSTEQNPKHTYTMTGIYSWTMTATIGTTQCTQNGAISIVTPPTITLIKKMTDPFRLKINGLNFHPNCTVRVNGIAVPTTAWKSSVQVIAKKGSALKLLLPAGQTVQITITNNDDGGVSAPYAFTR